ncbi:MAG: hypothetical protein N4A62_13130 [Marinisporobacter sp.]|nr:hypothetical protein [Marinisporobacter sp.]
MKKSTDGKKRPASKGEINDYYQYMAQKSMNAKTFKTIKDFHEFIEEQFKIIPSEWRNIALINGAEGGVEEFFDGCKTTSQLVDKLLIPVVEEAISENGTEDFVKTFEKQREHFKKHKQLRERINESKQIKEQIDRYVDIYLKYHHINEGFIKKKQYGKALYLYVKDEQKNIDKSISENRKDMEQIEADYKEIERKESYYIAKLKEKVDATQLVYENLKEEYDQIKYGYDEKQKELTNLKIGKIKREINETKENIEEYEMQLRRLEEDTDVEELKEKLVESNSKIRGYFIKEEENFKKEKILIEGQIRGNKEQLGEYNKKLQIVSDEKESLLRDKNEKEGQRITIEKNIQALATRMHMNPQQDNIKEQQLKWKEKIGQLEKNIVENHGTIHSIQNEKTILNDQLASYGKEVARLEKDQTLIHERLENINKKHSSLLEKIKEMNNSWNYMNSLYTREDSIIHYIGNKCEYLRNEKENLLLQERIARRFIDDYQKNKYFTPDPLLEEWVKNWKSQFSFVEIGSKYIQRASNVFQLEVEQYMKNYPYWSMTIVVEENEVLKLEKCIHENIEKMTVPIFILREREARSIIEGRQVINENIIFPKYWVKNMNQDHFKKWKEELNSKAKEITQKRQDKEYEMDECSHIFNELKKFFIENGYEYYQRLQEEYAIVGEQLYSSYEAIGKIKKRQGDIDDTIRQLNKKIMEWKDENNLLNNWVQLAQDYMNGENEKESLASFIYVLQEKINKKVAQIKKLNREIETINAILQDLRDNLRDFEYRMNMLKDDPLYGEVIRAMPKFVESAKVTLEIERQNLKDLLYKTQGSIKSIEGAIKKEEKNKKNLKRNLEIERKQSEYAINEAFIFPSYGEEEIEKLITTINELKPVLKELENKFKNIEDEYNKRELEYTLRKQDFYKKNEELYIFKEPLYKVKDQIQKEKKECIKRKDQNEKIYKRLNEEKMNIDKIINNLQINNGRFSFLIDGVEDIMLGEDTTRDFPYDRKGFIDQLIHELTNLKNELSTAMKEVENHKNIFTNFCNDCIKDPKLKERTIAGVRYKNSYKDMTQWQNKMHENLSRIIKIAEDDMREHDKELEQFIQHLYTYVATVTDELRIIPKNTRIKVEDQWKEIYKFNIPEWNQQEGKEELRKHVDWMIKQLESNQFKNEDGSDKDVDIRKEIEKWLQSKQLLRIILKNNVIKVSCRKVTNDGKVSSAPTTWENSNKWSGGEKWSKNMTLFLGILNYLAEKRQSIIIGIKTNRTVIVDNPFGKASSDHVLDPVFFIAEKLGFQLIALTAHTEGKFIRNYFPVVYSCKLRETVNGNSLIIDKEKEIHYAFFKDHDPKALLRLGEQKQMNLFEI